MTISFDALKAEYTADLAAAQPTRSSEAVAVAKQLLVNRTRFLTMQQLSGVPALWVMPVFEREQPSFNTYLGNGDPLSHPTVHVPRGRGPFDSWEKGAVDALTLDHIVGAAEWTWEWACWQWEKWNGFGPRNHGRPSGYLWSGTTIYQGGKYVADGVWSRGTFDRQLGTVEIARAIAELDPEIAKGFTDTVTRAIAAEPVEPGPA
jgi:lysozyme family protein